MKDEVAIRMAALAAASRVHAGRKTSTVEVICFAAVFEAYLNT